MNKMVNSYLFRLVIAVLLGGIALITAVSVFAGQYPSDIYMNRAPVKVLPGQIENIDWTITFTNTPISYSFSIYSPGKTLMFSKDYSALGERSPIKSNFDWPVPTTAISGAYVAEIIFFTKEISDPFDSQAAITFIVSEKSTPSFGSLAVFVCEDKNANGVCREPHIDRHLPGVELCLDPVPNGQPACQNTGDDGYARWPTIPYGSYTVNEHLVGAFRGYYPSSPMTQSVTVAQTQTTEINFSIVFPLYPRGVAVNPANDKVYAAFQGIKELDGTRPYAFVAAIDSRTDRVIATVPDVGREPFGMAVSNNKVYLAAFREGVVTVIDSQTDRVIKKIGGFVHPAQLAVDPTRSLIYVTDPGDGQVRVIDTQADTLLGQLTVSGPEASEPYNVAFGNDRAYTALRQIPSGATTPFYVKAVQQPGQVAAIPLTYQNQTGKPYAIAARASGANTYLYITYAKDFQPPYTWPSDQPTSPTAKPINPTQLMVVEVPNGNPAAARRLAADMPLGNFAENGLAFNPNTNHLLGVYGGGFYEPAYPDALACALIPKVRADAGSAYRLDVSAPQTPQFIDRPTPRLRVGNSIAPLTGDYWWLNPFDLAVNPNNNKVYSIDRCWHDYDTLYDNLFPDHELWHDGGGAVFVFNDDATSPLPTPTPTPTPSPGSKRVAGRVNLQGRSDSQGAVITINSGGPVNAPTDGQGYFRLTPTLAETTITVIADAPGYLPAACSSVNLTGSETNLGAVTLLSGDLNDDQLVDIHDLTVIGSNFGRTGLNVPADINRNGTVDIFDLILVTKNFGKRAQVWNCLVK